MVNTRRYQMWPYSRVNHFKVQCEHDRFTGFCGKHICQTTYNKLIFRLRLPDYRPRCFTASFTNNFYVTKITSACLEISIYSLRARFYFDFHDADFKDMSSFMPMIILSCNKFIIIFYFLFVFQVRMWKV